MACFVAEMSMMSRFCFALFLAMNDINNLPGQR
jgi:hypothetical protein